MSRYTIDFNSREEVRSRLETFAAKLPDRGTLILELEAGGSERDTLSALWEEMGSSTGALIGRFIGAGSEIAALSLQSLQLGAQQTLGNRQYPNDAGAGQENDEPRGGQPAP